jgi:outer membrane immunogenic protein
LLALSAFAGAAQASDSGGGAYDWSGFSAGVNAGAAFSDVTTTAGITVPAPADWLSSVKHNGNDDEAAFTGGASLGYDWQFDHLVLGVETDINFGGFQGDQTGTFANAFGVNGDTATQKLSYSSDWYGTLRGRMGFAADNMLFYGTAGLAVSTLEMDNSLDVKKGSSTTMLIDDKTDWLVGGWTAGAGVEYGFDKWSLGAEYLYISLPVDSTKASGSTKIEGDVDYGFSVLRATAKLRF